ncbi:MAG: sensor histidine kinase [Acidimicrobiales bacterium]|jgi:signal transduction histidine kinase|nr:sensor histidine kinase [Acidimicrobiales bacterium]
MSNTRDRLLGLVAGAMVVLLGVLVVISVRDAEANGKRALERLQVAQVQQLARGLDSQVTSAFAALAGFGGSKPWNLAVGDPADASRLQALQDQNPTLRTGFLLLDARGIITNGTLLQSPVAGRPYTRPGIEPVLQQRKPVILSVAPGLTTPLPTLAIAFPVQDAAGGLGGAMVIESDVSPDSAFNQQVTALRRGRTVVYSFIDSNGTVVASSDLSSIGKKAAPDVLDPRLSFHHSGSNVIASALVPVAGWRAVFQESSSEFQGKLTGPLHSALLLIALAALAGGGLTFAALLARLRSAREEQRRLRSINAAREEFISIVSHELRTPATGQLGFLETTLDHWDGLDDTERREAVSHARSNARRLHALTRDVLSTASIEAGELPYAFEVVDVRGVIRSAADAIADATVAVDLPGQAVEVRADPARIEQVMTNLVDNALKNSPPRAEIAVTVGATAEGEVLVEVADRGSGMTEEQAARAFDKFARGRDQSVEGTGLGLYICKSIVEAHGGRIWVARRPVGTSICFTLPLAGDAPPEPEPTPATATTATADG